MRTVLRRVGDLFRGRRSPRQARLYGVGTPRSGTHSVAAIFDRSVRLLVVPTGEIADFAGIARQRIAPGFRAQGVARATHGLLDRVDAGYLEDRVAEQCGALMQRFFPGIRSRRDAQ